ncbi:hypothetical protein [Desulfonatronovibrio hydrogenovorans]|uniref:hypothetical protein n=1 Tax=Desulfonatronovibrio hydrogenovorans TaxID=53245 RepID=UPI00048DBEFB|nr:hypothetical protein [Desulfonatronovibrio hydrogenovorans]
MVNLGLVKDFKSCPLEIPRLSFDPFPETGQTRPELRSWPVKEGVIWELILPRDPEKDIESWVADTAHIISGLNKLAWCVDTHQLIPLFNLPLDKALREWGRLFWPRFRHDCIFYFSSKSHDSIIRQVLLEWGRSETTICFRNRYDLTIEPADIPTADQNPSRHGIVRSILRSPLKLIRTRKN